MHEGEPSTRLDPETLRVLACALTRMVSQYTVYDIPGGRRLLLRNDSVLLAYKSIEPGSDAEEVEPEVIEMMLEGAIEPSLN